MSFCTEDIKTLHQQLVDGQTTAVELVERVFDRMDEVEDDIQAFISSRKEQALEEARAIDEEGIGENDYLKGIPIALKDNIIIDGEVMTAASRYLENYVGIYDATIVERLREAGAIIIGKTNLDEFAMGSTTETSYFHPTANAWDNSKIPGGSSGGSAAAVASGQVPVALGTDTGGSVRTPAAFNGLVGLKPSYGLIPRFGVVAMASSLDTIGAMTHTVYDNAAITQVLAGHDEREMTSIQDEAPDYLAHIDEGVDHLTIGVIEEFENHDQIDSQVQERVKEAIAVFEQAGAKVQTVSIPRVAVVDDLYLILQRGESNTLMERYDGIRYGHRAENYDDLESLYVNSRTEGFGEEVKKRIVEGMYITSAERKEDYYHQAARVRTLLKEDFQKAFEQVDIIITPQTADVASDLGQKRDPQVAAVDDQLTAMANLGHVAALTVPCGFNSDGLPVAMQIVGSAQSEATLFQAGHYYQSQTDFHTAHPDLNGGK